MEKGCKNHRETLYSSKGKIVYIVGKPHDNYRISPQYVNITGFPHNIHNLSLWGVYSFSVILTPLFHRLCRENLQTPRNARNHLQCILHSFNYPYSYGYSIRSQKAKVCIFVCICFPDVAGFVFSTQFSWKGLFSKTTIN